MSLRDTAGPGGYVATEKSSALPSGNSNLSGNSLRALSTTKGASQTSDVLGSLASTAHQDGFIRKFISDPLVGISSIQAQTWQMGQVRSESNGAANTFSTFSLYVIKSDDTVRGFVYDSDTPLGGEWTDAGTVLSFSGSAVASIDPTDRLCLEVWYHAVQSMGVSYDNTIFYNGATDVTEASGAGDAAAWRGEP